MTGRDTYITPIQTKMTALEFDNNIEEIAKINRKNSDAKAATDMAYAQGVSDTLICVGTAFFFLFHLLRIVAYLTASSGLWSPLP